MALNLGTGSTCTGKKWNFLKCITRKFDRKTGISGTVKYRIGQNFLENHEILPYPILPCT